MLKNNDADFQTLSLKLNRMEKDFSQQLAHWRESLFSYQCDAWLVAIRKNSTVEKVMVDLSVSENTIWKKDQIRVLMEAIGSMPRLRKLVVRQNLLGAPRRLKPIQAIIGAIKQGQGIECVEVWGNEIIPGSEELLQELAEAVAHIHGLTCFKLLGFRLDPVHGAMFVPLMNLPSVTKFGLGSIPDGFAPVAESLQTNTNLEKLTLSFVNTLDDSTCMHLVSALRKNTTLQMMSLLNTSPRNNHSGISERAKQALVKMMKCNTTLVDFKTHGNPCDGIHLYLKLNRVGRQQLFQHHGVTRELWVEKLIFSKADLDCSFFFLTMNPSLCVSKKLLF